MCPLSIDKASLDVSLLVLGQDTSSLDALTFNISGLRPRQFYSRRPKDTRKPLHCHGYRHSFASSSFVLASYFFIHCLAALDFGAGVEQPFGCLFVQSRQAVQSVGRSMDWTLEDDMVDGLFICATLTGRRGGHTPFVQAGAGG